MSILTIENLGFHYDGVKINVFNGLNYEFEAGKIYAVMGKSGAGKTTLLSLLAGLASPTEGRILLDGKDTANIDKYNLRSKHIGVVFQSYNLLPHLNAFENVLLSMDVSGKKYKDKKDEASEALEKVGIEDDEMKRKILKLSGGQQQRVAIARALSYDPKIILADEPTGNLDGETQEDIMDIFRMLADEGKCIIIVTHSPVVANRADVVYQLVKPAAVKQVKRSREKVKA
ncbi:MAG: ABC transporter ATP-binding protein [Eubacteriales bacterium]|nr:ABC transporter ATP-binding protein [Eubacteriales bacterium]